jgi:hypothetical protein
MRDLYTPDDPVFIDWQAGVPIDPKARWPEWYDLIVTTTARGVVVRRARIVSEPVTGISSGCTRRRCQRIIEVAIIRQE